MVENRKKGKCIDCGEICNKDARRCKSCHGRYRGNNPKSIGCRFKIGERKQLGKHWKNSKEAIKNNSLAKMGSKNSFYGKKHRKESIEKNRLKHIGKKASEETKRLMKEKRKFLITPKNDTSIEVKIQNYLKQLGIEFCTHQYIKEIEHAYQCDILIPVQEGITKKTIIECDGNYWHNYPYGKEIDAQRRSELREKGFRVISFWENEIKVMELNDLRKALL